jgi:hypothetical protein
MRPAGINRRYSAVEVIALGVQKERTQGCSSSTVFRRSTYVMKLSEYELFFIPPARQIARKK